MGAGFPTGASAYDLLKAMKDKVQQDQTQLRYLTNVEITTDTLGPITNEPNLFLVWKGSPEVPAFSEGGGSPLSRARILTHVVEIVCIVLTASPYREQPIMGSGREIGLAKFVDDVIGFYSGNTLGITALNGAKGPTCVLPDNGVTTLELEEEGKFSWLVEARLRYEAEVKPFKRV